MIVARMFIGGIFMLAMHRVLDMLALFPARLAIEGQEDEAPRIEAGEEGHENADPEGHHAAAAARISRLENAVLRIEAGETRNPRDTDAGNRQRAEHHRPTGARARFPQLADKTHKDRKNDL